jgi:hypothetical protein
MTAFFTVIARGISTTVPVAGGGATPAGGAVPSTAMVTAPVAEADGSVPTSSHSGSGGEAGGLQKDNVSVTTIPIYDNKAGNSYLEVSTTCAFCLRTTRRPCGTDGKVSANSTDGPGELSLLASPSASFSARGFPLSVVSLLGSASAA